MDAVDHLNAVAERLDFLAGLARRDGDTQETIRAYEISAGLVRIEAGRAMDARERTSPRTADALTVIPPTLGAIRRPNIKTEGGPSSRSGLTTDALTHHATPNGHARGDVPQASRGDNEPTPTTTTTTETSE